jgi:hypothetical protein
MLRICVCVCLYVCVCVCVCVFVCVCTVEIMHMGGWLIVQLLLLFKISLTNFAFWDAEKVPLLRQLAAGLSSRRPGFSPRPVHVGFVVDKVALEQALSLGSSFFPC